VLVARAAAEVEAGKRDLARPRIEEALALQTARLGRRHPDVARTIALRDRAEK
jgi:hypothetical protein